MIGGRRDTATTEIYTLSLHDALPIYFFQVGDGPALTQHVPVAPRGLGLPRGGEVARGRERGHPAHPALPGSRNLSLGGKRDGKVVTLGAIESYLLAWCQVGVTVVIVARRP